MQFSFGFLIVVLVSLDLCLVIVMDNVQVEVLNPLNGEIRVVFSNVVEDGVQPEDDAIAGLHLFKRERSTGYSPLFLFQSLTI
jgi:hypothetical protein